MNKFLNRPLQFKIISVCVFANMIIFVVNLFLIFGINPLFLYVLSEVLAIIFGHMGISTLIYNPIHAVITHNCWASCCYAIVFTLICGAFGYLLYKKKIYIKI